MKLSRLGKRAASAALLMVMSGAFWACSGDDNGGTGAGGSTGLGGTSGSGGKGGGGTVDSGKDSAPDVTAGSTGDARPDGSGGAGGSGGSTGTGGSGGVDSSMGGGAGDASVDRDAVATSDARDATPDQGAPEAEAGSDAPRGNDGPVGSEPQPEAAPPSDASDAGIVADASDGNDGNDGNNGQVTSDASSDHTACTVPAGVLNAFTFATDEEGWTFSVGENPTPHTDNDPPDTTTAVWSGDDGCPSAGQLRLTIPFNIPVDAEVQIQGAVFRADLPQTDFAGRTAIHVKLKVESQAGLQFVNPFVQFNDPNIGFSGFLEAPDPSTDFVAANLGTNVWNDLVIPLPAPDAGSFVAGGMGIQVFATVNGTVRITIDSIYAQ